MKVDGSLGSLLQGVSQQPPRDRFDGQGTLQENMQSDAVKGLTRRPPTDLVGYLGSTSSVLGWHNFQTRDGKKFLAMFKDNDVGVFDLNAIAQSVAIDGDARPYLSGTTNMKCSTDGVDNTVVVNPNVVTRMTNSPASYFNTAGQGACIFQVLGGSYAKTYSIYIGGTEVAWYRPPDGAAGIDVQYISTTHIATRLLQGLMQNLPAYSPDGPSSGHYGSGACAGWAYMQQGDIFWVQAPSGTFTISVADGSGGVNLKSCTDNVAKVADLPRIAPHYYAVRIAENSDSQKDLWFKFIVAGYENVSYPNGTFGPAGYWTEAVAPNTDTAFNPDTMPHRLIYNAPGFAFKRESYFPRTVGTTVSNANPSFVDNKINDVAIFQGRTVFLSGSNVIMSRTSRPTNFWKGSASALADTDPIDINSTVESSQLLAAVQYNKDLAVFSPKAQFIVFGRTALTPQNAVLVLTTRFESELQAHPVGAGRNVLFASNFGRYTGIREFYAEGTTDINDSRLVTQHTNKYLAGKATRLTASANYELMLVHTDAVQTDVYIYKYIWSDDKKIQSSWSTWRYSHQIVHSFFDEDVLYLVQRIGNDYFLLRAPLDVQDSDDVGYPVFLDERFDVLNCYQSFVLPFNYLKDSELVCVQGANCPTPGLTVTIASVEAVPGVGQVVTLKKNMNGGNIIVGSRFLSRYIPTMPLVKDQNGAVIGTAKVRAKSFAVSITDTGQITGRARSKYGDGPEVSFNARIVGDVDNIVGEQPLSDEKFIMPFRFDVNDADMELYTDSHLPMTLVDIEYVGQYTKRGRRIANTGGKQ
jgi:hypothetical protein